MNDLRLVIGMSRRSHLQSFHKKGVAMFFDRLLYSLPPLFTAVLLGAMAANIVFGRHKGKSDRLFAALCFFGSLLYIDMLINFNAPSARIALMASRIGHLFHPFLLPLFIHFFHLYLGMDHRRSVIRFAYGYAALVAACAPWGGWIIADTRSFSFGYFGQGGPLFILMGIGAVLATAYNVIILYRAIRRESRSIYKNKLHYLFIGFGLLGILTTLNCLTLFGVPVYPPGAFGFIPLIIFAAGFFRYDLLDSGVFLRKGFVYLTVTMVLAAVYLLVAYVLPLPAMEIRFSAAQLSALLILIPAAIAAEPLAGWLQQGMDRMRLRGSFDHRMTLNRVSQTIASILDRQKITQLLQGTIIDAMQVTHCTLFLADPAGNGYRAIAAAGHGTSQWQDAFLAEESCLVSALQGRSLPILKQKLLGSARGGKTIGMLSQMRWLRGEAVFPMCFRERLKGFLVLGEKRSGRIFSAEDLDLLLPLCHQSALAIQNAHAYQALRELNQTLEAQVAARTEALETALAEKERSQEQLIRSESLAALGQLVAGVAHELNNPLTSVTSLLQSITEELSQWDRNRPLDADLLDDLHFADKELARARSIVASLLGLSRQTQAYEEAVDMTSVVQDALRVLHNQYKHRQLYVETDLDPQLPKLQGNFAHLGQVALNIIQNAIQALADSGGQVCLRTWHDAAGGHVVFQCRDNGSGIEAAIRQDVFKPFFTTKPVGRGTGLGLYICHQIVQRHGGTIALAAADPRGTEVTVRLPVG